MSGDDKQKEIEDMAFAMYCQVRWCRGQVMHDQAKEIAKPLFFALQNPEPDVWHFRDLNIAQDQNKFEQFQRIMWNENAIGIVEFYDTKTHYVGQLYNFTGVVLTLKSTLKSALRSYRNYSLEECQDRLGPKELKVSKDPVIPVGWNDVFKTLLKEQAGL